MPVSGVFVVPNPSSTHIPAEKALMFCCPHKWACLVAPGGDSYFCYVALDMSSRCLDPSDSCSQWSCLLITACTLLQDVCVHCFLIYWPLLMGLSFSKRHQALDPDDQWCWLQQRGLMLFYSYLAQQLKPLYAINRLIFKGNLSLD